MSNPLLVSLGFKVPEWFRIWSCRFLTSGLQPGEIINILPWESMESVTIGTCQPMHHWKQLRWSDSHVMCHLVTLSSWQVHLPTFDKHVSAGCGQFPTCNGRIWSENCAKPTQIGIIQMEKVGEIMGNIWKNVDQHLGDVIFSEFSFFHTWDKQWLTYTSPISHCLSCCCAKRSAANVVWTALQKSRYLGKSQHHVMNPRPYNDFPEMGGIMWCKYIFQNRVYSGLWHWARRIHNFQLRQEPHLHKRNTKHWTCETDSICFEMLVWRCLESVWQTILGHTRASNSSRSYCHVLGQCVP